MNTRAKGQILESYICDQIKEKGLDAHARPSHNSGATNREKSDIWTSLMILGQNIGIEAKNQKVPRVSEWWKQTKKLQSLGREPVLVFKEFGEPLAETKCLIYLDTFLELAKSSSGRKVEETPNNREFKWALDSLKVAINKVSKYII